ncbi:MAG TPA: endolytic transglycosylase MltG [Bryobacteraceae bacterium]|nr:endolytic transglycosylase MltG [Bryobacteraceae bacterium]
MIRLAIRVFVIAIAVALLAILAIALALRAPYKGFENEVFLRVERGSTTQAIGRQLADSGVVRYAWQFYLERAFNRAAKLQAGEYRFSDAATPARVFDRMARGDVYYFDFTVKEGSNIFDIATSLDQANIMKAADFLNAAENPALIRDLAPSAPSLEGFLFPSTYRLTHFTTAADLCRQMTDQFRKAWKKLSAGPDAGAQSTVTLASMVEKETGVAEERTLVAGVFANRLAKGMKLDCDPTVIYAALLDNRYRNAIHKSDLASQNSYNTYQHAGLPPGPIANPGAAAIAAALAPAKTDYLYFVAKPEGGGHQFSATIAEHTRAAQAYRKRRKHAAQ